jgi:hypothetical protein
MHWLKSALPPLIRAVAVVGVAVATDTQAMTMAPVAAICRHRAVVWFVVMVMLPSVLGGTRPTATKSQLGKQYEHFAIAVRTRFTH